ncbi:glycosyltransferase [Tyzzerella sp. OttesenSCG-928-J15]|nr:glycosyltransferase [Tyzzerella sp. OttesenSCG-928-J15]
MAITVSLCMIVKNEENKLSYCLDSIHDLVDEINIIDTGSTDKTVEIAKKYTDRVFFFEWINDFSAARNYSFSKATKEYILWLDADDVIYKDDRIKFKKLKETLNKAVDVIYMDYIYKKDEDGKPSIVQSRERMVKRENNFLWRNKIHEILEVSGKYIISDVVVNHDHFDVERSTERNNKMIEDAVQGENVSARELSYYVRHLIRDGKYDEALKYFDEFERLNKESKLPVVEAYIGIYEIYLIYKKDYEKAYLVLAQNEDILKDKSEYYCYLGSFAKDILSDYKMAAEYYEKAVLCPCENSQGIKFMNNMSYYYHIPYYELGMCYIKLNDYIKAKYAFENALKYKEDSEVESLLEKINELIEKS